MTKLLTIVLIFSGVSATCQNFQNEINDQVWKPFIASFDTHNTEGFMALHSKEVVRSPRDSKSVLSWEEYFKVQRKGDQREKDSGTKRSIQLHFAERIANANKAIDVGIYKMTVTDKEGKSASYFGRFHVVMRREDHTWKILVDTDSSEGDTIAENDFIAAHPME